MSTEQGDSGSLSSDNPGPISRPEIAGGSVAPRSQGSEGGLKLPNSGITNPYLGYRWLGDRPPAAPAKSAEPSLPTAKVPASSERQSGSFPEVYVPEQRSAPPAERQGREGDEIQTGHEIEEQNEQATSVDTSEQPQRVFAVDNNGIAESGKAHPTWSMSPKEKVLHAAALGDGGDENAPSMRRHLMRQMLLSDEEPEDVQVVGIWHNGKGAYTGHPIVNGAKVTFAHNGDYRVFAITKDDDGNVVSLEDTRRNIADIKGVEPDKKEKDTIRDIDRGIQEWVPASQVGEAGRYLSKLQGYQEAHESGTAKPGEGRLRTEVLHNLLNNAALIQNKHGAEFSDDVVSVHADGDGKLTRVDIRELEENFAEQLHLPRTPVRVSTTDRIWSMPVGDMSVTDKAALERLATRNNWLHRAQPE